ncbi:MAG: hypothetical protein K0U52_09305 [Gammaproteobacteria bacterium]|nr:hypothetical protein [Gammaproteobacteria bacterium]
MSWYDKMMNAPDRHECVLFEQTDVPRLVHSDQVKQVMRRFPHKARLERHVETTMATVMEAILAEAFEDIGKTQVNARDVKQFMEKIDSARNE